jgi:hypothetical protein
MAQPLDFMNDTHKRMMRAHDKRITELQKECDKLKGDIEEYPAKMRKLQRQLMNGDVHRGRNTLQTSYFDSYDHSNQDIIARFFKNKLFSHHKFLHPSRKDYSPSDKNSLCYKCNEEIDIPVTEDSEFFLINKTMPMINKKYCKIRANINSQVLRESILVSSRNMLPKVMLTWPTANQSLSFFLLNLLLAMLDKDVAEINYKDVQELLVCPKEFKIIEEGYKQAIFAFVAKFVSRIYGICMINTWLSKKRGSTFFDLMTISDIAYTVAVLENSYEVWDQEYNKKRIDETHHCQLCHYDVVVAPQAGLGFITIDKFIQ